MKYLIYLFLFFNLSCSKNTTTSYPKKDNLPVLPLLDKNLMPAYIDLLPTVLKESEAFIQSPQGQQSVKDPNNKAFYQFLYQNKKIVAQLQQIGFSNSQSFELQHETVVTLFILLMKNPNLIEDAELQLLSQRKELDKLVLKQARDKNNSSLNEVLEHLKAQVHFYENIQTLAPYLETLQKINTP